MNREELIAEISKSAKVTKKEASEVLSATIDAIQSAVKKGETSINVVAKFAPAAIKVVFKLV